MTSVILLALVLPVAANDWPMLGHDITRSGGTSTDLRPPFVRQWYRLFADEGLQSGVQPVVAGGRVYLGTLAGVLHAMDAETGTDVWTFQAGGPILHAAATGEGKVYFGAADGLVYAVHTPDGKLAWCFRTGAAIWNAPAVHEGSVYIGSRDGCLYVLDTVTGQLRWKADTAAPLLGSPAIDPQAGRVYVASEAMRVHAFALADGRELWCSEQLPGASMRGYHPVIAPDGSVMVTTQPVMGYDRFQDLLLEMVREVFGDFASWRHQKDENDKLRADNFRQLEQPETYAAQLDYLRRRLTAEPAFQTFFVLDPATGRQRCVAPIVASESMNGPGAPPVVTARRTRDREVPGPLAQSLRALLAVSQRGLSRSGHWSHHTVDGSDTHLRLARQPVVGARRAVSTQPGGAASAEHASGQRERTGSRHSQRPSAAAGIEHPRTCERRGAGRSRGGLARQRPARGQRMADPRHGRVWRWFRARRAAWLLRVSSFYYLPTHEINSGCALIAYRMAPDSAGPQRTPLPAAVLTEDEWERVQDLPWDWDTLATPRLKNLLDALPAKVPGTLAAPLRAEAEKTVAAIPDRVLDAFIWEPAWDAAPAASPAASHDVLEKLRAAVRELIGQRWRPLVLPASKAPEESYRVFNDPSETLYTLMLARPLLDDELRSQTDNYVDSLAAAGLRRTYETDIGTSRVVYDVPQQYMRVVEETVRDDLARLYPLWLWSLTPGGADYVERNWTATARSAARPRAEIGGRLREFPPRGPDGLLPPRPSRRRRRGAG